MMESCGEMEMASMISDLLHREGQLANLYCFSAHLEGRELAQRSMRHFNGLERVRQAQNERQLLILCCNTSQETHRRGIGIKANPTPFGLLLPVFGRLG